MNLILSQNYKKTSILKVNNYYIIKDKEKIKEEEVVNLDPFGALGDNISSSSNGRQISEKDGYIYRRIPNHKCNLSYFHVNGEYSPHIELDIDSYKLTDDVEQIKEYYNTPFTAINNITIQRAVWYDEVKNKLKFSFFTYNKIRNINSKFFHTKRSVISLTIDLENGNLIFYSKINERKIKKYICTIRTNLFKLIDTSHHHLFDLSNIEYQLRSMIPNTNFMTNIEEEVRDIKQIFDDNIVQNILIEKLTERGFNYDKNSAININLIKYFALKKDIKMTDNTFYLRKYYPGIKILRKNDMNLTQSIMSVLEIKSKYVRKLINTQDICLYSLKRFSLFFGDDCGKYLSNINHIEFFKGKTINSNSELKKIVPNLSEGRKYNLTKKEKENMIKIINDSDNMKTVYSAITLFEDHFNMMDRCRKFYPDLSLTSTTLIKFNEEHFRLSNIISKLRKMYSLSYVYNERTINDLESPILCLENDENLHTLHPFILKRDEDYEEEGRVMHHCVSSYINKEKSIIISLRTEDNNERITVEYSISTGQRVQARYIQNKNPPKKFEDGLMLLDMKVLELSRLGLLNWVEKIKVPIRINGVEVDPVYRYSDPNPFLIEQTHNLFAI